MARNFFESAWGSSRLWLERLSADQGRSVIVQQYTRGNIPDVRDRGNVPDVVRCAILFDEMQGETKSARERLEDLVLLKEQGKPQLFVHPIFGTYLAHITEFTYEIESTGTITAEASFIAIEEVGAVTVDPVGVTLDTSVNAIAERTDSLNAELANVDLSSDVPAQAASASDVFDGLQDDTATARDALVQIATVSDRMWDEIDALNVAADVELWPLMKAYVMLGDAVRASGDQSLGGNTALMTIRVDGPTSLRRLVSDIYGANEAQDRYDEAMALNDIRTPARIPTGTQLRLRQPATR